MNPSIPSDNFLLTAIRLLGEWEQTRPVSAPPLGAAVRGAFAQFVAEALRGNQDTNLDEGDVRDVLRGAAGLGVGRAETSGAGRALRALAEAYHTQASVGPGRAPRGRVLLSIQSRPDAELEMDELTDVVETVQHRTAPARTGRSSLATAFTPPSPLRYA